MDRDGARGQESRRRAIGRLAGLVAAASLVLVAAAGPASAADALTMDATVLLQGHVRSGAWTAIDVSLANTGAPISGELRYAGGTAGQVQFATAVDLPPQSRKTYELFVQPPQTFGTTALTIALVSGDRTIATRKVSVTAHDDYTQLVIGVVAEHPEPIVSGMRLLAQPNSTAPAIIPLSPKDLPSRAEAWAPLDRLVWQDVDSSALTPEQIAAMQGWIAQGGRLTIVGGTSPAGSLSAFPDDLLPYRPTTTVDVPADAIEGLTGSVPAALSSLPALAATASTGRVLARNGDVVIAAERSHGGGVVTLVGFDPDAGALAGSPASTGLWERLQPARSGTTGNRTMVDENTIVNALSNLPAIGLPPIGGLLLLLVAYIVLIGPINYLVLRRLDRREWAWLTMPALIVLFAAGAYGYGTALRGTNIQVSEVTIVRGGVGASTGAAQAYLGVFSPARSTYQLSLPDGALVTAPVTGDPSIQTAALHVLQGEPARVRDLDVGFASLRALRADTTATVPGLSADLRLEGGRVVGTIRNDSPTLLQRTAIAFGSNAQVLGDLQPGETRQVALMLSGTQWGMPLSQLVLGDGSYGGPMGPTDADRRSMARRFVLDQLTYDPMSGMGQLQSDTPVLLAWGTDPVVPVEIQGERPQVIADTLYYMPLPIAVHGDVVFGSDLMRSTVVDSATTFFNKDPTTFVFGQGSVTLAFRPVSFSGTIQAKRLAIALNVGPNQSIGPGRPLAPLGPAETPAPQPPDGIPSIELLDRASGSWVSLPHLQAGVAYDMASPGDYVDPSSGSILVRLRNDRQEQVGFQFSIQLEGTVE